MKRYRFWLAGLSLLITGCSASPASTAAPVSNASPEVAPATSSTGPQGFLDEQCCVRRAGTSRLSMPRNRI